VRLIKFEQEEGAWAGEAQVVFPRSEKVFEGHFPHAPVVPGVTLVDAAVEIAIRATGFPLRLRSLSNAKFCSVVLPDQEVSFSFRIVPDENTGDLMRLSGRWARGGGKVAEMQGVVARERGMDDAS